MTDAAPKPPVKEDAFRKFFGGQVRPAAEKLVNFVNTRNTREKVMIIALTGMLLLFLDYWLLIRPVVNVFNDTLPKLAALESKAQQFRTDKNNAPLIEKEWLGVKSQLDTREAAFISPNQLPALLENLSKLAQDSGVKILSLKPIEIFEKSASKRYGRVPIKISAIAGSYELGAFLARLESGPTFFRVTDIRVTEHQFETKRHNIDLSLETYRRIS